MRSKAMALSETPTPELLRQGTNGERREEMSYISPKLQPKFETLSIDLKNEILSRNVHLENLHDLINVLEQIVSEEEAAL